MLAWFDGLSVGVLCAASPAERRLVAQELHYHAKLEAGKLARALHTRVDVFRALARAFAPEPGTRDLEALTLFLPVTGDSAHGMYLDNVRAAIPKGLPLSTHPEPWPKNDVCGTVSGLVRALPITVELRDTLNDGLKIFVAPTPIGTPLRLVYLQESQSVHSPTVQRLERAEQHHIKQAVEGVLARVWAYLQNPDDRLDTEVRRSEVKEEDSGIRIPVLVLCIMSSQNLKRCSGRGAPAGRMSGLIGPPTSRPSPWA